jgi:hypothetical protein
VEDERKNRRANKVRRGKMGRGNTDLTSNEYDQFLSSKQTVSARRELEQRHRERKNAHDKDGRGWHFGIGDKPVKVESREEFRQVLKQRGLVMENDLK